MMYETLVAIIQRTSRAKLKDTMSVAEELYHQIESETDSIDSYCKLYDLFDLVLQQPLLEGSESDFHNLAVTCSRQDDYTSACCFLDRGLEQYPYSLDLLSDYLSYGMSCGRVEACEKAYNILKQRHNAWNWRAYHFSIRYLLGCMSINQSITRTEIMELITEFQKKLPKCEEAYIDHAEFLFAFPECETDNYTFETVLKYATSDECPIQRTPKCDLRLADFYYNAGKNLTKANDLIERCKRNSIETQPSVNRQYVYLLSSLCKMSQYYDSVRHDKSCDRFGNDTEKEEMVLQIYEDYHIAASGTMDPRVHGCKGIIEAFICETKIPYPYDDDIDNNM